MGQSVRHYADGLRAIVDHDEAAAVFGGGFACRAAACEEVQNEVAGVGVDLDDAL